MGDDGRCEDVVRDGGAHPPSALLRVEKRLLQVRMVRGGLLLLLHLPVHHREVLQLRVMLGELSVALRNLDVPLGNLDRGVWDVLGHRRSVARQGNQWRGKPEHERAGRQSRTRVLTLERASHMVCGPTRSRRHADRRPLPEDRRL
jgi:hypothetical protein